MSKKKKKKAMNTLWQKECKEMDALIGNYRSRQEGKTIGSLKNNQ